MGGIFSSPSPPPPPPPAPKPRHLMTEAELAEDAAKARRRHSPEAIAVQMASVIEQELGRPALAAAEILHLIRNRWTELQRAAHFIHDGAGE
jgi:hypothetical protein